MLHTNHNWSAILTGTAVTTALVMTLPTPVQALTGREVNDIAREITVLFRSELGSGHGSGFIISRDGDTYYVLTADHVVRYDDDYTLITADHQAYAVDYEKIQRLPGVDLAIVEFESKEDYPIAQLGTASTSEGQDVFVSGWPGLGAIGNESDGPLIRQFTSGQISGFLPEAYEGYQMIYTNITRAGMSGGPVLDSGGRVVAIHGLGDKENLTNILGEDASSEERAIASKIKIGFNYAIPISTYLMLAPQAGIYLNISVETSPAPEGGEYQAEYEPTERDQINDLASVLNSVNNTIDTIQNICGLFGC